MYITTRKKKKKTPQQLSCLMKASLTKLAKSPVVWLGLKLVYSWASVEYYGASTQVILVMLLYVSEGITRNMTREPYCMHLIK